MKKLVVHVRKVIFKRKVGIPMCKAMRKICISGNQRCFLSLYKYAYSFSKISWFKIKGKHF